MNIPNTGMLLLHLPVQITVALLAKIDVLARLQRVIQRNPLSIFSPASIAFSLPHSALKDNQGVSIPAKGLSTRPLRKYVQILEDNDVVAALEMAEKVGPPEDHSQVLHLCLSHLVKRVSELSLHAVLL
jgi:hypothetical protein